ncbi:hypothetical protein B0O80DRAFT_471320 [Mortierella sp. GBAus27b]|nr:N-terminal acetyltransferase [Mortierella sp. GBA43]KAI8345943.1 hypothetical protein B0O80DRAFT_471320 [Mortierella sp. GBAus27b]
MSVAATQEHFTKEQILDFLRHVNFPLAQEGVLPEPTLETLRELQYRFVTSIPFETLSLRTTESRSVDISLAGIYDRIINKRRGGWCFSLNRLGYELLYGIGYKVQITLGRVCKPKHYGDPIKYSPLTHRISLVRFEDGSKYLFDIGFGNSPYYPLELKDGAEIEFFGHRRRMGKTIHNQAEPVLGNPAQELWCMEEHIGEDRWVPCYVFSEIQCYENDCVMGNFYTCHCPSSVFYHQFWVVLGTLDGKSYLLINNEFKIKTASGFQEVTPLKTEQERLDVLKKYFGIELTEEELKYHDKKIVPRQEE